MENIVYNISEILAIAIIHSLWQALIIYFMLRMALVFGSRLSAATKYSLGVSALLAITCWFIYTMANELHLYSWTMEKTAGLAVPPILAALPAVIGRFNNETIRYYYSIEGYLPYISLLYAAGLIFNSARLLTMRLRIQSIRRGMSVDVALQQQTRRFAEMLGVTKKVIVGISQKIDVPCMAGHVKPVILLPFSLATLLTTEEIESILLHELAHIRRNDYLVNLLQQAIAILLFFNPCAILINRIINEERENSCDDLVVKATANPLTYAKALLKAEQIRQSDQKLALAATGSKYYLLTRIQRIMKTNQNATGMRPTLAAMLILTFTLFGLAVLKPEITHGAISIRNMKPEISRLFQSDTTHKKTAAVKKYHHTTAVHKTVVVNDADDNKKMGELNAEIQKHSQAINSYYNSAEFKKLQDNINALSKQLQGFYDQPDLKQKQDELNQASQDFNKTYGSNTGDQQRLSQEMNKDGKKISAYFESADFKKLDKEERLKYGIPLDKNYDDDNDLNDQNYQNYKKDVENKLPADVKGTIAELEQKGKQMSARFESADYKEKSHRMQELGDSVSKAYQNPEFKEKQEEINRLSLKIGAYQNNADLKHEQALLNQAVAKLNAYMGSAEYKSYLKKMMNVNMNYNFNYNFNHDDAHDEKAEKPEPPEKPEAPEKPDDQ